MYRSLTTCALVAASDFNAGDFSKRVSSGCFGAVIAVDGGYEHVTKAGVKPDTVIGDFDSLGSVPEGVDAIAYPARKDKSDLELALELAESRGFTHAVIYGALGGRLDHTVANVQMCARFAEAKLGVELVGLDNSISYVVGPGCLTFPEGIYGTVSVFSMVPESRGVTERGLSYALDDAVLCNRTTQGLSNELVGCTASISVKDGTLLVFHPPMHAGGLE